MLLLSDQALPHRGSCVCLSQHSTAPDAREALICGNHTSQSAMCSCIGKDTSMLYPAARRCATRRLTSARSRR